MSVHESIHQSRQNIPSNQQTHNQYPEDIEAEIQRRVNEQLHKEREKTMQSSRYTHHDRHGDTAKSSEDQRRTHENHERRSPAAPTQVPAAHSDPATARLQQELTDIKEMMKAFMSAAVQRRECKTKMPFMDRLDAVPLPLGFILPQFTQFNDKNLLPKPIEKLIKRGYLKEYMAKGTQRDNQRQNRRIPPLPQIKAEPAELPRLTGRIDTIFGGVAGGGDSRNSKKNYARRQIYSISQNLALYNEPISFSDEEPIGIELPHDDPIVIAPTIEWFTVERMLVDTGSSVDILYIGTFDKLHLPKSIIQSLVTPLTGLTGHSINPIVVALIGLYSRLRESEKKAGPHEEVLAIPFNEEKMERTFRIGSEEFEYMFAWGSEDMPGIDPTVALHKLYVDPDAHPMKQNKRLFNDEKNIAIREEVQALLRAQAIRELKFPAWVANVVVVKKPNGKWRMCTDFTNLNKACPKDFYPLPCLGAWWTEV
ncbi:hypothetical protein LIER_21546 [Lithospermum erythrorhizon]|uniref:Peptidase A2 domain-containing protein n=1 Tax=Lithospermum erythrorhizon TaxID=34254 RepID=A0AAV3QTT1_LITER